MSLTQYEKEGFVNLFYLFLFLILFILILAFIFFSFKKMFPLQKNIQTVEKKEDIQENFLDLSIDTILSQFDDEGNLISLQNNEDDNNNEDEEKDNKKEVTFARHPKNKEVKEKEISNNDIQKVVKNDLPNEINTQNLLFILDKNRFKRNLDYRFYTAKKEETLHVLGYYDPNVILQVKDKDKDVTTISNKIYNKYNFLYQTKNDDSPIQYSIEYRPSQERFIKLYDEKETKAFYLEKIVFKSENSTNNSFPLYTIYHFAEKIGTIYSGYQKDDKKRLYKIEVNNDFTQYLNIIAFTLILYLSITKEDFED